MALTISPSALLEALAVLYEASAEDNRPFQSYQPHEILGLLANSENYTHVLKQVIQELIDLEEKGGDAQQKKNVVVATWQDEQILDWIDSRELLCSPLKYFWHDEWDETMRATILYGILSDLTAVRWTTKTIMRSTLSLKPLEPTAYTVSIQKSITQIAAVTKNEKPSESPGIQQVLEVLRKLSQNLPTPLPPLNHLIIPTVSQSTAQKLHLLAELVRTFNEEYRSRCRVFIKRLDATIGAFLWSRKCQDPSKRQDVQLVIERSLAKRSSLLEESNCEVWDAFAATRDLLAEANSKVSAAPVKSVIRTFTIGTVPDRGGVPEGYTLLDVKTDVQKANQQLQQKSGREAAALQRSARERGITGRPSGGPGGVGSPASAPATLGGGGALGGENVWQRRQKLQHQDDLQRARSEFCYDTHGRLFGPNGAEGIAASAALAGEDVEELENQAPFPPFCPAAPAPLSPQQGGRHFFEQDGPLNMPSTEPPPPRIVYQQPLPAPAPMASLQVQPQSPMRSVFIAGGKGGGSGAGRGGAGFGGRPQDTPAGAQWIRGQQGWHGGRGRGGGYF